MATAVWCDSGSDGIQRRLLKPVWNILEGQFTVVLANAQHIKNVRGRKTDQKDAEWIAVAAVWSSAGQLCTLRNHSRSTRPDQNAGQSLPESFAHQWSNSEGARRRKRRLEGVGAKT